MDFNMNTYRKALRPVRVLFPHEGAFLTVVSALRCEGASFCCISIPVNEVFAVARNIAAVFFQRC